MKAMKQIFVFIFVVSILFSESIGAVRAAEQETINWAVARQLLRKQRQGETLTDDEKAYLERARKERGKLRGSRKERGDSATKGKETTGLIPLTELGNKDYKKQTGGLYGNGKNRPPESHQLAAGEILAKIRPLDIKGKPSKAGKIVLISIGMSNTTQEFSTFKRLADNSPDKSPQVVIVDCAQGGMAAEQWAHPERKMKKKRRSPWIVMNERITKAGISPVQVQVAWIKQAQPMPARLGEFPKHAQSLKDDLIIILNKLKQDFPNLQVAYLSSRIYAGYAVTSLNPEPYAYESAFAVRWLIHDQIRGDSGLNYDPAKGEIKSPFLLWGPYLWADGVKPRKIDNLTWTGNDFRRDGTHPSDLGCQKVAQLLLNFFKTDYNARSWFRKSAASASSNGSKF